MIGFIFQTIGSIASGSIGSALVYIPEAILIGVVAGGYLVYRKRKAISDDQKLMREYMKSQIKNEASKEFSGSAPAQTIHSTGTTTSQVTDAGSVLSDGNTNVSEWAGTVIAGLAKKNKKSEGEIIDLLCLFYLQNKGKGQQQQAPPQQGGQGGQGLGKLFSGLDRMEQDFMKGTGFWGNQG